jgi:hypothetical protein
VAFELFPAPVLELFGASVVKTPLGRHFFGWRVPLVALWALAGRAFGVFLYPSASAPTD